ncbi:hypothetical protein ADL00_20880 [Streptomyces sp. AS58]|uniref:HAD family hydrolase n=1 Tax=Streptomyces cadmiisoli TaxID=2184053 RepID=A0A2Z4J1H5_9ACTN|nr:MULTISPECIES: HAD family hydrolase [Streptomyces]AWW38877.1 HAD family hydrolase [Streptomyces cadmiisoli]KOV64871.1 hypothetical protein ADL00_20880 [Streptomyces sp. AS58]
MRGVLDEQEVLQGLLADARAVLLDFDGPVTRLFGGAPTAHIAERIKGVVRREWGPLDPDVEECEDSHRILLRIRDMYDRPASAPRSPAPLKHADRIVTDYEYEAVVRAEPVPHFDRLVEALLGLRLALVIVSNNADGPVWEFLKRQGLQSKFEAVLGRDSSELRHMKPHPYAVRRAVEHLAIGAGECLLVGDQLTDLAAARAAGTRFLGHTWREHRAIRMREDGADWVVSSHLPVIDAAEALRKAT